MKIKNMFLIFMICFFCCISNVSASHSINYDIRYFNINSSNKMTLRGWSMISHADNYGGTGNSYGKTNGSLRTYIAAYVVTGNSKWEDIVSDVGEGKNIIYDNDCELINSGSDLNESKDYFGNKRCILFETTPHNLGQDTPVNLFYTRCIGENCDKSKQRLKNLETGAEKYSGDQCAGSNTNKGIKYSNSHCMYHNVGFNVSIDLKKLYKHFIGFTTNNTSYYKKIYFRIVSDVYVYEEDATAKSHIMRSTGLAISKYAFDEDLGYTTSKSSGVEYYTVNRNFSVKVGDVEYSIDGIKISGLSEKVKVTAGKAIAKESGDFKESSDRYLEANEYYYLDKSRSGKDHGGGYIYKQAKSIKGVKQTKEGYTFYTRAYAIKGCECDKVIDGRKMICNDCKSYDTYYIPTSWARPYGTFVLNSTWKKIEEEPTKCIICADNTCKGSDSKCDKNSITPNNCLSQNVENDKCGNFSFNNEKICKAKTIGSGDAYNTTYYYAIDKSVVNGLLETASDDIIKLKEGGATNFKLTKAGGDNKIKIGTSYYYIPINFYTDISYGINLWTNFVHEKKYSDVSFGNYAVNNNSEITVKSGRFFHFVLRYGIEASWNSIGNNRYGNVVNLYYTYTDKNGKVTNSDKTISFQFNLGSVDKEDSDIDDNIWVDMSGNGVLSLSDTVNGPERIKFDTVYSHLLKYSEKFKNVNDGVLSGMLDVEFPDSNKISGDVVAPGNFKCDGIEKTGDGVTTQTISTKCDYTIPQAFLRKKDGYVFYGEPVVGNDSSENIEDNDSLEDEVDDEEIYIESEEESNIADETIDAEDDTDDDVQINDSEIESEDDVNVENSSDEEESSDSFSGNNEYTIMSSSDEGLYYIPYNMKTGDIFKFTISSGNLSLIQGFNFYYNATCQVKAEKEKVSYRAIDTSNPFPKADATYSNIASNWKEYYDSVGNFSRIINNSYDNISYRTNMFDNVKKKVFATFNSTYGNYGKANDMDTDAFGSGNSAVIHNSGFDLFEITNGIHCGSAEFSSDCDGVQQ